MSLTRTRLWLRVRVEVRARVQLLLGGGRWDEAAGAIGWMGLGEAGHKAAQHAMRVATRDEYAAAAAQVWLVDNKNGAFHL